MHLEIGEILIKDVQFNKNTEIKDGVLYVNKEELIHILKEDEHLASVDIEIARPGESVRITPIKDVIEPRVKVEGAGGMFPGVLSKVETVGSGRTNALKGCAVMTVGKIVGFQEGIVDMVGPGADLTPFSKLNNIVLVCKPVEGLKQHDYERALRLAGLKAAAYLGEAGKEISPDKVKIYETAPINQAVGQFPNLPKIGYIQMLQSQGLLHDTYVYGVDAKQIIPTIMYPTELMDGAIISGNCVSACDKNTTYHHQNNPVIEDLYAQHGKEINFIAVIITNENVYLADKERSSAWTTKLAQFLGLDGVIISQEGFGNPDTDLIMNCKKLEEKGIKTVIITDEFAGRDGGSQALADSNTLADAVVTAGNANEIVVLPKMDKVIGTLDYTETIAGGFDGSMSPDGSITVEIQAIIGSTNELGYNKMSAKTV